MVSPSSIHKGWHRDIENGRLAAVYNGTEVFDFDADDLAVAAATVFASTATVNNDLIVRSKMTVGTAGVASGDIEIYGATSGNVTLTVADTAGTWQLTLPADDGDAGEQLQTNGSGVTTWEAAGSLRMFKNLLRQRDDEEDVLKMLLETPVYDFKYKRPDETPERITTTGDAETVYTGIVADEAPWAMHHNGRILNPINALGYTLMAIKALTRKVETLEAQLEAR